MAKPTPETPGPAPVDLVKATCIGHGWKRICFIHPNDPSRCIKVGYWGRIKGWGWRDRLFNMRLDRGAGAVLNRRELQAYGRIGTVLADYVPRYHGPIATTLGDGLECDLVRDATGGPAKQLRPWLANATAEEAAILRAQFDPLFDLLHRHEIWLFDLNTSNFVVQKSEDGTPRMWLIDLKRAADHKEIFQVGAWTRGQKHRKLTRRIKRFFNRFDLLSKAEPEGS